MSTESPTMIVQRQEKSGWEVLMTPPGFSDPIRITGFKNEKAAWAWVDREAMAWLAAHKVAA